MTKLVIAMASGLLLLVAVIGAIGTGDQERQRTENAELLPGQVPGIDPVLLDAYGTAAGNLEELHPGCTGMTWQILAGIGREESDHAAASTISDTGDTDPPIIGPTLDGTGAGNNWTPHYDTDNGRWDDNTTYDAAVGVTQLLPKWWAEHGVDGNDDGVADPHNVYDATASTTVELCTSHPDNRVDFSDETELRAALHRYNPWDVYVDNVMSNIAEYEALDHPVPEGDSEKGRIAADWAIQQLGKPYVWGGTGPNGFDCSGLVLRAWEAAGVTIPRVTVDQVHAGTNVPPDALAPGDLLFYDTGGYPGPPSHVTMYVGDGQMIHAPRTGQPIRFDDVANTYYAGKFMSAVRPG